MLSEYRASDDHCVVQRSSTRPCVSTYIVALVAFLKSWIMLPSLFHVALNWVAVKYPGGSWIASKLVISPLLWVGVLIFDGEGFRLMSSLV